MKRTHRQERGQALVIIVFGIVAMVGLTGLAIDGGNAYSDRRHAQNAADTAALAAALARIRDPGNWITARDAALARARDNGFDNNGTGNTVHVYLCFDPAATCVLPPPEPFTDLNHNGIRDSTEAYTDTNGNGVYDDAFPADFVQVTITSHVKTYFAPVLGIRQLSNYVQAIAHAKIAVLSDWYGGNALVALMPGCKSPGWPNDPFTMSGNEVTIVNGSGVFVNSNCANAFTSSNNTELTASDGICVVGGVVSNGVVSPPPQAHCGSQVDPAKYQLPGVDASSCTSNGQITEVPPGSRDYIATAGNYSGSFPNVSPAGTLKLGKGIYCLNNSGNALNIGAGWNVTTDLNGNSAYDNTEGVLFYIPNGGVSINGHATVNLDAMTDPTADIGYKGYLFYVPPTNSSTITINGNGSSHVSGTVLAPSSLITLEGTSGTFTMDSQLIGYSIKVSGTGDVNITYDGDKLGKTYENPLLTPYK